MPIFAPMDPQPHTQPALDWLQLAFEPILLAAGDRDLHLTFSWQPAQALPHSP